MSTFQVTSLNLHVRSEPKVKPSNKIAILSQGHIVVKVGESDVDPLWWSIKTTLSGSDLNGFVNSKFLTALASDGGQTPSRIQPIPIHLAENKSESRRASKDFQAFPLGEGGRPGISSATPEEKINSLLNIIEWLKVENSIRYKRNTATYCNIYACDYCYLAGVYLPRIWWKDSSVQLSDSGVAKPLYGNNVHELNANSLFDWLSDFGKDFGWNRLFESPSSSETAVDRMQMAANNGDIVVICAKRKNLNESGHICLVVPESSSNKAERENGVVKKPLQSQAGGTNFSFRANRQWWRDSDFRSYGFWVHP